MLKKIAIIFALVSMVQGMAFAASYTSYTDIGTVFSTAGVSYKPSNNVQLYYLNDGVTQPQLYNIGSKNTSGSEVYATSNRSGNIYKYVGSTNVEPGVKLEDVASTILPGNAGESTGWGTDWSAL